MCIRDRDAADDAFLYFWCVTGAAVIVEVGLWREDVRRLTDVDDVPACLTRKRGRQVQKCRRHRQRAVSALTRVSRQQWRECVRSFVRLVSSLPAAIGRITTATMAAALTSRCYHGDEATAAAAAADATADVASAIIRRVLVDGSRFSAPVRRLTADRVM